MDRFCQRSMKPQHISCHALVDNPWYPIFIWQDGKQEWKCVGHVERKKYSGQIPPWFNSLTVTLDYLRNMFEI